MIPKKFDVVLLGHLSKDKDIVDGKERDVLGGAVYYGAFPLKLIGINVAVVTKLSKEDFPELSIFKKAGIPVFATEAPQTTGIRNVYSTKDPDKRQSYPLGFAGSFSEKDFPDVQANIIHIGALMRGEVPLNLVRSLSKKAALSLDVQGFVRVREGNQLIIKDWKEKEIALPYVKYLKTDIIEAKVLTGTSDLLTSAKSLSKMGPSEVLITYKDGAVLFVNGKFYQAPFSPKSLRGRTGRGDTCICTYIAKRLSLPAYKSLCFATALTTLKLEKEGPFRENLDDVKVLSKKFELSSA